MQSSLFLYIITVLIWGSTWLAIKYQLGEVAPVYSISYRFALAAALLLVFCLWQKISLKFNPKEHLFIALQGFLIFSANYVLIYEATAHLTSGLVAVVFSTMVFLNIINGAILFKTPIDRRVIAGACSGLIGICLVFLPELTTWNSSSTTITALIICISGTYVASLGSLTSARNQRAGIAVLPSNAIGMAYGALFTLVAGLVKGDPLSFDYSAPYIVSLLFLAIPGTVIGFWSFLTLIGRIGADRAAYAMLLFPIIALGLSTLAEGYTWTYNAFLGVALILAGNVLVLWRKSGKPESA